MNKMQDANSENQREKYQVNRRITIKFWLVWKKNKTIGTFIIYLKTPSFAFARFLNESQFIFPERIIIRKSEKITRTEIFSEKYFEFSKKFTNSVFRMIWRKRSRNCRGSGTRSRDGRTARKSRQGLYSSSGPNK